MIMDEIIARKRHDLSLLPKIHSALAPSTVDFLAAITAPGLNVIAEVKAKSPSTGILCEDYQPDIIAERYKAGGAVAISVLTDTPFFGGEFADMTKVKALTGLPVLCKDFVIDEQQIEVARAFGADAVLLIVRVLDVATLRALKEKIESYKMLALIEIFDEADLEKALLLDPKVLMINHRDLDTLKVDCRSSNALIAKIPAHIPVVAASGINKPEQVLALDPRICAVLIGTSLLKSSDPVGFMRELNTLSRKVRSRVMVKICGITNLEDALLCEALGADFLGFIFEPSSARSIDYGRAKAIIAHLKTAKAVGVFVQQAADEINRVAEDLNLAAVQIYEDYVFVAPKFKIIRVVRVQDQHDLIKMQNLRAQFLDDYVLLDTYHAAQMGGTGHAFDWRLLPEDLNRVFLSGGLNSDNVKIALTYAPFGLDLASGVEARPGKKSLDKLKKLFEEVRHDQ